MVTVTSIYLFSLLRLVLQWCAIALILEFLYTHWNGAFLYHVDTSLLMFVGSWRSKNLWRTTIWKWTPQISTQLCFKMWLKSEQWAANLANISAFQCSCWKVKWKQTWPISVLSNVLVEKWTESKHGQYQCFPMFLSKRYLWKQTWPMLVFSSCIGKEGNMDWCSYSRFNTIQLLFKDSVKVSVVTSLTNK